MSKFKIGDQVLFNEKKSEIVNIFEIENKDTIYHVKTYDNMHYKTTGDSLKKIEHEKDIIGKEISKREFTTEIINTAMESKILNKINELVINSELSKLVSILSIRIGLDIAEELFKYNTNEIDKQILIKQIDSKTPIIIKESFEPNNGKIEANDYMIINAITIIIQSILFEVVEHFFNN